MNPARRNTLFFFFVSYFCILRLLRFVNLAFELFFVVFVHFLLQDIPCSHGNAPQPQNRIYYKIRYRQVHFRRISSGSLPRNVLFLNKIDSIYDRQQAQRYGRTCIRCYRLSLFQRVSSSCCQQKHRCTQNDCTGINAAQKAAIA